MDFFVFIAVFLWGVFALVAILSLVKLRTDLDKHEFLVFISIPIIFSIMLFRAL